MCRKQEKDAKKKAKLNCPTKVENRKEATREALETVEVVVEVNLSEHKISKSKPEYYQCSQKGKSVQKAVKKSSTNSQNVHNKIEKKSLLNRGRPRVKDYA